MKTETLFRGRRTDTGEWVYWTELGKLTASQNGKLISGNVGYADWAYELLTWPWSEGQYIGLSDSAGTKVFAGDVTKDKLGRVWVVFAVPGGFAVCRKEKWAKREKSRWFKYEGLSDPQSADWFVRNHEVIGNIHDHPELLNKSSLYKYEGEFYRLLRGGSGRSQGLYLWQPMKKALFFFVRDRARKSFWLDACGFEREA